MNSLEKYQKELVVMSLLVGQQDEIINDIEEKKELQESYVSIEIIEAFKKIMTENSESSFIDFKMKNKIIEYLDFFRDINTMLGKENKKDILKKINECIVLCNLLDTDVDTKVFYANQLYERTQGWQNIDKCYECTFDQTNIETINLSIFLDLNFFNQFIIKNSNINNNLGLYNNEFAIWSVNHFLNDIPEIITNENFKDNCDSLISYMKKNGFKIYKSCGLQIGNRIKKETKNLQKRLR